MVASWVGERLGTTIVPPYTAFGATIDGHDLCAGAVFNDFTGANIELTVAGGPVPPAFSREILKYVFVQVGALRLSIKTKRSNKHVKTMLARRKEFKFEGISPRYFGPNKADDAIRYALFAEDARKWLNELS
jgi:hypothetical protein